MLTAVHDVIEVLVMDEETDVVLSGSDRAAARSGKVTLKAGCNDVSTTWNNGVGVCSMDVTLNIGVGVVVAFVEAVELGHPVHVLVVMFELVVNRGPDDEVVSTIVTVGDSGTVVVLCDDTSSGILSG